MTPKLSVIIPCYNEEKRLNNGFNHFFSYLSKQKYSWELILVNDGSSDKTLEMMNKISRKNLKIKVVTYVQNRGKGYALVKGVAKATGKIILFSDIDHSVSVETIEEFFKLFQKGFKVVIGSRRVKGAHFVKRQDPIREFLGRGFTLLVRILIDPKIRDATCGFKAFDKEIAKKVFKKLTVYDWAFDAEALFICRKLHYQVAQVPVKWKNDPGTKVSLKRDIITSLVGIIKIQANNLLGRY